MLQDEGDLVDVPVKDFPRKKGKLAKAEELAYQRRQVVRSDAKEGQGVSRVQKAGLVAVGEHLVDQIVNFQRPSQASSNLQLPKSSPRNDR